MAKMTSGYDRLGQRLRALTPAVRRELAAAVDESARRVEVLAETLAPIDTGALRESVETIKGDYTPANSRVRGVRLQGGRDPGLSASVVAGDADAWYAALVEFGTKSQRAAPFLFPAFRMLRGPIRARMSRAYRTAAKQILEGGG